MYCFVHKTETNKAIWQEMMIAELDSISSKIGWRILYILSQTI